LLLVPTALMLLLQRGGDPVEVFGLLAPAAAEAEAASEHGSADEQQQQAENEAPSPASSVRSAVSLASSVAADSAAAGGKRSRIPTLSRAGLADRTNVG
jgi:hypothetical protein